MLDAATRQPFDFLPAACPVPALAENRASLATLQSGQACHGGEAASATPPGLLNVGGVFGEFVEHHFNSVALQSGD